MLSNRAVWGCQSRAILTGEWNRHVRQVSNDMSRLLAPITLPNGSQKRCRLQAHLLVLTNRLRLHNNGSACSYAGSMLVNDGGSNDNVEVKRAIESDEADGP